MLKSINLTLTSFTTKCPTCPGIEHGTFFQWGQTNTSHAAVHMCTRSCSSVGLISIAPKPLPPRHRLRLKLPDRMPLCVPPPPRSFCWLAASLRLSILRATLQPAAKSPSRAPNCPHVPGHVTSDWPLLPPENSQANLSSVLPGKLRPAAHTGLPRPGSTCGTGSRTRRRPVVI